MTKKGKHFEAVVIGKGQWRRLDGSSNDEVRVHYFPRSASGARYVRWRHQLMATKGSGVQVPMLLSCLGILGVAHREFMDVIAVRGDAVCVKEAKSNLMLDYLDKAADSDLPKL